MNVGNQMQSNESLLKKLWNEYHELQQQRVMLVNENLDTSELDVKFDQVCAEIERLESKKV